MLAQQVHEMESLSPLRRAYYNYLSRAYAVMYRLHKRSLLGIRLVSIARWLPILVLIIGWRQHWPVPALIGLLLAIIWLNYSLWRAKRDNFNRFVSHTGPMPNTTQSEPIPANHKIDIAATGLFSVSGRDNNLLLRPATYWRVPLGEHVVMVEEQPGKYLYQFFNAKSLQTVRSGWLLFGPQPIESLAVTFLARWGPEYTKFGPAHENGDDSGLPPPKRVTIYLSHDNPATRQAILDTLISDARQARLDAG